jgi:bla regulator protein blaR1
MITYILKVILFSALLLVIYKLLFEKEKMHRFNRFYLIMGIILSFTVPLITITTPINFQAYVTSRIPAGIKLTEMELIGPQFPRTGTDKRSFGNTRRMSGTGNTYTPVIIDTGVQPADKSFISGKSINDRIPATSQTTGSSGEKIISQTGDSVSREKVLSNLLLLVYLVVTSVLLSRFTMNIMSFRKKIKQNRLTPYHGATLVLTKETITPYSFLKYIFVNEEEYINGTIEKAILGHELIHIRQKHSVDIIFVELLKTFAWINPLLPLYRKAMQLNHEFLADEHVVKTLCDTKTYQLLLIDRVQQENRLVLSSSFNYLLTKKRIIMMGKVESPITALSKQIILIPVIVFAVLLFINTSLASDVNATDEPLAIPDDSTAVTETPLADGYLSEDIYTIQDKQASDAIKTQIQAPPPRIADDMVAVQPTRANLEAALPSHYLVYVDGWVVNNSILEYYEEIDFAHHNFGKIIERSVFYGKYDSIAVFYTLQYYNKHRGLKIEQSIPTGPGVQKDLLDEYERIISKYTPESMPAEEQARNIRENISAGDKTRLEDIYSQMTLEQRKEQKAIFLAPTVVSRSIPTTEQFRSYSNPSIYGVWVDGKRIDNSILESYSNTDFARASVSRLAPNALNYGKHDFQVDLMTKSYYENFRENMSRRTENMLMVRTGVSTENQE